MKERVTKALKNTTEEPPRGEGELAGGARQVQPIVRVQKMTAADDPEEFLNAFECTAMVAGWPQDQWVLILIPCLIGSAQ